MCKRGGEGGFQEFRIALGMGSGQLSKDLNEKYFSSVLEADLYRSIYNFYQNCWDI